MSDRDFYDFVWEGQRLRLPRVTAILGIIDKSRPLMGWAVKLERAAYDAAVMEALTAPRRPGFTDEQVAQAIYDRVQALVAGKRAWVRSLDDAANIGKSAHELIRWHTAKMLGEPTGPEPGAPDEALRAVAAWFDWVKAVEYEPLMAERFIFCPQCGFAGTTDGVGKIERKVKVVDYKTGKAVYGEAHLQVRAYRHGLAREGIETEGAVILRLPKTAADPAFEAVEVQPMPFGYFISASRLWRWKQIMEGDESGPEIQKCAVEG